MTPRQAEKGLRAILAPILRSYGFKNVRGLVFTRSRPDRLERIGFSVFKDRVGNLRYSFGVGVRFPRIEALRGNTDDSEDTPTVGVPMHFLRTPRAYFDWTLSDPIKGTEVVGNVREDLESLALPFLDKYSSMEVLRASLVRDDAREWFTLDSEQRDELLTLMDFLQRGKDSALQRLDAALERRANALPKTRYPLEKLRTRLQQESSASCAINQPRSSRPVP